MNWHGKPLGGKMEAAVAAINAEIKNQGPHGLCPAAPSQAVPEVNISNIRLSEPPSYTNDQKVRTAQLHQRPKGKNRPATPTTKR